MASYPTYPDHVIAECQGPHWGAFSSTAELPNVSGATAQSAFLRYGHQAVVSGELYLCTSPAVGAATWAKVASAGETITSLTTTGAIVAGTTLSAGTTMTVGTTLTVTGLTSGRVPYVSTAGLIVDEADFAYNTSTNTLNFDNLTLDAAATVGTTLGVTGATTLTGGIVASTMGIVPNIAIGSVALGSLGTDTALADGTIWYSELWLPANKSLTGAAVLNGTVAGTDSLILGLYNTSGTLLANTALAGTTSSGTDAFQAIAFTAPYAAVGPARYFVAVQANGTTAKIRTIAASTFLNWGDNVAGTFGTLASITPPTATAANKGPIMYVY